MRDLNRAPSILRIGPLKIHPRPLKQKPYPKAMTIALGIMTNDAIVIAADSEVSAGDYMSIQQNKVWSLVRDGLDEAASGVMVMTGAGDAAYLESATQEIQGIFASHKPVSLDRFESETARFLKTFHHEHIVPFAPDRPDIWLVIGASIGNELRLWSSNKNRLTRCRQHFAAVGAGEMYARGILQKLARGGNADTAKLIAAYAIHLVNDRIPGCGKQTVVQCIKRGERAAPSGFSFQQIHALEALFIDCEWIDSIMLHTLFNDPAFSTSDLVRQVEEMRGEFRKLIGK